MEGLIPIVPTAATAVGAFSHLVYFRVGEHHLYGMRYVLTASPTFVASIFAQNYFWETTIPTAATRSSLIAACYFAGLYTSLIVYRLFFHRLRGFPGPLGCKISTGWFATYLGKRDAFRQLRKLHRTHGPFLRISSNDLSIAHPKAVQAIYGAGSNCRKAPFYDMTQPMVSVHSTRDKQLHDQRRRVWSGAFGDRNLRDYETRMAQYRALLVAAIQRSANQPMDVTRWFNLFTFDVMGDLAFGSSFQMLETGKEHGAIKLLNEGLGPMAFMLPVWLFRLATEIPGMTRDWWRFLDYCTSQMERRVRTKVETPDIMSSLLKPLGGQFPSGLEHRLLQGDSQLIVVAGSDTTSATLISIFRFLVDQPHHLDLLRAEIDNLPRTELGDYQPPDLSDLKHLNGIINEALRLYPPVPSAVARLTPPEGLTVEGTFIPGNTTVWCPQYVIGRDPNCYPQPDEFIPERWYSRPELLRDASGFAPFSSGPYNCIGRPLALLNIRATVCRIVADYDVQLAAGVNTADYDAGVTEHFTLAPPPLELCFSRR